MEPALGKHSEVPARKMPREVWRKIVHGYANQISPALQRGILTRWTVDTFVKIPVLPGSWYSGGVNRKISKEYYDLRCDRDVH